jgi:hypothetical protein
VAVNVTDPVTRVAVNVPEPCERHPEQLIVRVPPPVVLTVIVVTPLIPLSAAVMVVVPVAAAVASPELLIVATLVAEEVQVTDEVTFWLLLSPNVPVAVNCCVPLSCTEGLLGVTEIATSVLAEGKNLPQAVASSAGRIMRAILNPICCGERKRVGRIAGDDLREDFSMRSAASWRRSMLRLYKVKE